MKLTWVILLNLFSLSVIAANNAATEKLYKAITYGNYKHAEKAIEKGADVNAQYPLDAPAHTTIIHHAINYGRTDIALLIISQADFNVEVEKPLSNRTPIHTAIMNKNLPVIKALVEQGANYNSLATFRYPIQIAAAVNADMEIMSYLLNLPEIDVNLGGRECALRKTVKYLNKPMFNLLLNHPRNFAFSDACIKGAINNAECYVKYAEGKSAENDKSVAAEMLQELERL